MKRIILGLVLAGLATVGHAQTGQPIGPGGSSYSLPAGTSSTLGGVKPDGTTITNNAGAISVTYGTAANTAAQGNDARLGAGAVTGAVKSNGSNTFSRAACADLSNAAASCATDTTNASNISSGTLGAAQLGNDIGVRVRLIGANLNTTADQSITLTLPTGTTNYRFNSVVVSNPSISMTSAVCGVWTGAGKTGTTIVGSGATGVAMSGLTTNAAGSTGSMINTTINNVNTAMFNSTTLFFACSTAQGATATADVTIAMFPLN